MRSFFQSISVSAVFAVVTGNVAPAFAAQPATQGNIHIKSITGLPNFDCASEHSNSSPTKCESMVFEVQVFAIKDTAGKEVACVAAFPYSGLTLHTTSLGERVTVKWHVAAPGAQFAGPGIQVDPNGKDQPGDLIGSTTASGQDASVTTKDGIRRRKQLKHLPKITLDLPSKPAQPCDGIDPIISNAAN